MFVERFCFWVWIEKEVDGGKLLGLEWEDCDKGIFKVFWKYVLR